MRRRKSKHNTTAERIEVIEPIWDGIIDFGDGNIFIRNYAPSKSNQQASLRCVRCREHEMNGVFFGLPEAPCSLCASLQTEDVAKAD
jgi:hypothetical protein